MIDQVTMKRLAFIRYLYTIGINQANGPEPLSSASVLTFHDSVELFLQLTSEKVGAGKTDVKFMEYWRFINEKLENDVELTQKESMRRLNAARVNFKHHGTMPSQLDIEGFRASVTNFFNENTKIIFRLDFTSISLIEIIQSNDIRSKLELAEKLLKKEKNIDALDNIALAFEIMVDEYESNKKSYFGRSPFFFGDSLTFHNSFFMGIGHGPRSDSSERRLAEFIDKVKDSIEALQKAVKILSLGIDYRKYSKFILLVPIVTRILSGEYHISRKNEGLYGTPTKKDVQFCIDFTIESYIKLQEFDYAL